MNLISFGNPWLVVGGAALIGGLLFGLYQTAYSKGYKRATDAANTEKLESERVATKALLEANARVLAAERKSAGDMADISKAYQTMLKEKDSEKDRAIAGARANGLYVGTKRPSCGNTVSAVSPGAGGRDDAPRAELSDAAAEYFISEAARADKIVEQLTACQALVVADRNMSAMH